VNRQHGYSEDRLMGFAPGEHSILAMIAKRQEQREHPLQVRFNNLHRMADLGTLVAGVAHDAMNILLPLRMRPEHPDRAELPESAREDFESIHLMVDRFRDRCGGVGRLKRSGASDWHRIGTGGGGVDDPGRAIPFGSFGPGNPGRAGEIVGKGVDRPPHPCETLSWRP
jgi:hypothetical protein